MVRLNVRYESFYKSDMLIRFIRVKENNAQHLLLKMRMMT